MGGRGEVLAFERDERRCGLLRQMMATKGASIVTAVHASFLDADGNPMARDDSEWRDACNNYRDDASKAKLAAMGLS